MSFSDKIDEKNKSEIGNTIRSRISFITNLLYGKSIQPMVNFYNTDTEYFVGGNEKDENDSGYSYDTRVVLQKKYHDFTKIIMQIGNGEEDQLEYIKSGTSGHTFHGMVKLDVNNTFEYGVKVVAYPKKEQYGDMYDVRRPENAELKMIKLLSYFVVRRQTPHIVLPIGTFDTSIETFTSSNMTDCVCDVDGDGKIKKNEKYDEFMEKYKNGDYYDKVSILISEWANRGDLLDFLRKYHGTSNFTLHHWKSIFFQLLSVLAVIQSKYPSFRHNDLKANNLLVHKITKPDDFFTYRIAKKKYRVKNIGYQIKMWDFDFACIPGIVDNKKVESEWTKTINVTPTQNRYYDVHYFFNTLIKKSFCSGIMTNKNVPQEVRDFINRLLPEKYRNDPLANELKSYIEKNIHDKYKDCQYGTKFINGYPMNPTIRKYIENMIPDKFKHIKVGVVHEKGRLLVDDEYLTPLEILETDPFFAEYRIDDKETQNKNNPFLFGGNNTNESYDKKKINIEQISTHISPKDIDIDKVLGVKKSKKTSKRCSSKKKKSKYDK
ncbi:serine/threonine-protein kinase [Bodo saltans virus]|uniref:Serine/threonine-protein kinase n=1 Tax=Bodo saltans virus TaxID=2024608 RepID=A0A2H4UUV5_9VIRU|nr:serine/threonine-protein kinase [Bodo saltans virus]ATZ80702.1 serine/threonine-protein kinase [Bodo saltans virus]